MYCMLESNIDECNVNNVKYLIKPSKANQRYGFPQNKRSTSILNIVVVALGGLPVSDAVCRGQQKLGLAQ